MGVRITYCIVWYTDGEDDIRDKPEAENSSVTSEKLRSLLQIPEPRRHFRSRAKCSCSRSNQRQPRHPHPLKRRLAHRSFPSPNLVCGVLGEQPAGGEDEGFEVPTGKRPHPGRSLANPVEVASALRESVLQRGAVGWRGRGHSSGIRRQERILVDKDLKSWFRSAKALRNGGEPYRHGCIIRREMRGTKSFVTDIQVQRVEEEITIMLRSAENERVESSEAASKSSMSCASGGGAHCHARF